jgi:amidase
MNGANAGTGAAVSVESAGLCSLSARELARQLRSGRVSARDAMRAHLEMIRAWNPHVNALVAKLDDQQCLALADEADRRLARGEPVGALHGLPWAFKDLEPAIGFPCTFGSAIFRHDRPAFDSVLVERLRRAGVLPIAKTNTPEFGMGSQTYNDVYGTTLNPYDLSKTCGGSSGGAAVGVACGMLPAADGSDLGGSLRNPGNFNNVVGFRPSAGLVPMAPTTMPFLGLAVKGPFARSVADAAFVLSVMAGPDARDPASYPSDPRVFTQPLARSLKNVRIAWCPDLGGLPLDPRVAALLEARREVFESLGCIVEEAAPDLDGADQVFLTLRAFRTWTNLAPLLALRRAELKPEAVWEIEYGAALTTSQISAAMVRHGEILERFRQFQQRYPFLIAAVNQVPPFDAHLHWPRAIEGVAMENYVAWMKSAYWITTTLCPAISVPAGFTPDGLPVGIQIVGPYREDLAVLQLAHAFEEATGFGRRRPVLP